MQTALALHCRQLSTEQAWQGSSPSEVVSPTQTVHTPCYRPTPRLQLVHWPAPGPAQVRQLESQSVQREEEGSMNWVERQGPQRPLDTPSSAGQARQSPVVELQVRQVEEQGSQGPSPSLLKDFVRQGWQN